MIKVLDDAVSFAPQIQPSDIAVLAEQGYTQIICNRPDEEEAGQPSIASIQAEADQHGLKLTYAPVANSQFTECVIDTTQQALTTASETGKTLMFCRSGTRSSVLWAMVQTRQGEPLAQTLAKLAAIGYDITHMEAFIAAYAKKSSEQSTGGHHV